jgi:hypothetical protein
VGVFQEKNLIVMIREPLLEQSHSLSNPAVDGDRPANGHESPNDEDAHLYRTR